MSYAVQASQPDGSWQTVNKRSPLNSKGEDTGGNLSRKDAYRLMDGWRNNTDQFIGRQLRVVEVDYMGNPKQ